MGYSFTYDMNLCFFGIFCLEEGGWKKEGWVMFEVGRGWRLGKGKVRDWELEVGRGWVGRGWV